MQRKAAAATAALFKVLPSEGPHDALRTASDATGDSASGMMETDKERNDILNQQPEAQDIYQEASAQGWHVSPTENLAEIAEKLKEHDNEKLRVYAIMLKTHAGCDEFMKRVQKGDARPVMFKDFNSHGKVDREALFVDTTFEGFCVRILIHFSDVFDEELYRQRKPQSATTIIAISLRHHQHDHGKAEHYGSMFKHTYLEDRGYTFETYRNGWRWKHERGSMPSQERIQTLMQVIEDIVQHSSPVDPVMPREPEHRGIHVLTFGNSNYSLLGLANNGQLRTAAADARAVAEAFQRLGARTCVETDTRDVARIENVLDNRLDSCFTGVGGENVCVVVIFWAGHVITNKNDDTLHLLPVSDNLIFNHIRPGRHTFSVKEMIEMIRERSQNCKVIVCMDSMPKEFESKEWRSLNEKIIKKIGSTDIGRHRGFELWLSATQCSVSMDGTADHSLFTECMLSCLQKDLQNKTFDDMWCEIESEMSKRDAHNMPSRYISGMSKYETLLPPE